MKRSKSLMVMVVVVLILTFTITTVGAQSGVPPVGELDEDGERVVEVLPSINTVVEGQVPAPEQTPQGGLIGIDVTPAPVSPIDFELVYDKTPTFKFTELLGATKYKIEVYDIWIISPVYTFKGDPNCTAGICKLTPDIALKNFIISGTKGRYYWRVKGKVGGEWQDDYSAGAYFTVMSTGFTSTFTTDAKKWLQAYGYWFIVDSGYLKTKGVINDLSSVVHKEYFSTESIYYTFEAKLKRKVDYGSNRIIVAGYLDDDPENGWDRGYEFMYYDDGFYQVIRRTDDVIDGILCSGTDLSLINEFDWNKLTVFHNGNYLTTFINGELVCDIYIGDDSVHYYEGYVGIMEFGMEDAAFLVDNAKVVVSYDWPYAVEFVDGVRVEVGVPAEGAQPRIDGLLP